MSELIAAQNSLGAAQQKMLAEVVGSMLPASAEHGVPGADDPAILAEILVAAGPHLDAVAAALAVLDDMAQTQHASNFAQLPAAERGALLGAYGASGSSHVRLLISLVLPCYYRDERVVRALGEEPRPPFPQGFVVEQGDWSLLDPVRARGAIYRQV